ncbi:hypothetical protein VF14_11500 [Nostoc linckia z18]|jgi:hypothetical protein|uniref:Plastid lipid-associated protein/fibrillin conserved domain-containing protein n=2 Tax=Nostoc linckia TaxID=92942 RepID=A0A9Q6EK10_NOSLI|nr:hypothetical protein [Nostoc linckia]PHK40918.1 hypothetical protein VF12_08750 [Nostoc linckia z15]PHK46462.1 hypothetical protein VF13_10985 [Nostoc linckia z16]PHJ60262.1 hypothetical protein VF02_23140 [Nostoc linckia z1]PHJ63828.1 hypothetical protein VF05_24105 [Nostoc linckia z3]PHJ70842.1 hypothetical protein VF03_21675 [Nostoc linckia z2]
MADLVSDFVTVLSQAAAAYRGEKATRPSAEILVQALLAAEKTAKQQRLNYGFESLLGKWRLCFATGTKKVRERGGIVLGKGLYVPKFVTIYISFNANLQQNLDKGEIANQVELFPLLLKLTGPIQYQNKKNLLAFDFHNMLISLFGGVVYNNKIRSGKVESEDFYSQPIAKLPFFAFFIVTEDFIAARGRGGGLALWIREK